MSYFCRCRLLSLLNTQSRGSFVDLRQNTHPSKARHKPVHSHPRNVATDRRQHASILLIVQTGFGSRQRGFHARKGWDRETEDGLLGLDIFDFKV